MYKLTVFTPTFNRAKTLQRTYESLCRQNSHEFIWLIIDDGSTDDTKRIVEDWISEDRIPIKYIYKENGGLHTGYIAAIANIDTELNLCIDSDDYMPDNCVNKILEVWNITKHEKNVAGLIGLDYTLEDKPIGGRFSKTGLRHFHEVQQFHDGDVKIVCRTDVLKALPVMPSFKGEKNFNPVYYYVQVDKDYTFNVINEKFCYVDYQPNGMSINILHQFRNSPKSFAQLRRLYLSMPYYPYSKHFRNAIHYVSSCIFSKEWNMLKSSPRPFTTFLAIPMGIMLNCYVRYKTRR